jgi:putative FmdB family regulatory protein
VPIYEFRCDSCRERFEALAEAGTETAECRACGAPAATRVLSAPAGPMNLVGGPRAKRAQERRNAALHRQAKADFKAHRRRSRDARKGGSGG